MRAGRVTRSVILAGTMAALTLATPAMAQVTMDNSALDALRAPEPHRVAPVRRPVPARRPTPPPDRKPEANSASTAAQTPAKPASRPPKPQVPATPPAILALPPPLVVPLAHPPPAPVVPVAADAPGAAIPIDGGLRVTFGPDRADMNPATVAALRGFAQSQADQLHTSINIYAYATGSPDDPSTPRRLSLERALAARAVLLEAGIASPRIYPRAMGPAGGSVDPDRVDVMAGRPPPQEPGHAG